MSEYPTSNAQNSQENSLNREFKGNWIPREIWLNPELTCQEKFLLIEIHSLHSTEKGGCFASNEHLMKMVNAKERQYQRMLANLKKKGYVKQLSFNGRQRILLAILNPKSCHLCGVINDTPPVSKMTPIDTNLEDTSLHSVSPPKVPPVMKTGSQAKITFNYSTGEFSGITPQHEALFKAAYPLADLKVELPKMALWLLDPKHKKKSNFDKFIRNWLSRAQEDGLSDKARKDTYDKMNKKGEKRVESQFSYEGAGTLEPCHKPLRG